VWQLLEFKRVLIGRLKSVIIEPRNMPMKLNKQMPKLKLKKIKKIINEKKV
jgi:hypothetical protein